MSWFKVDDGFLTHPKVFGIKAGPLALWLRAGLWCAKELTDGVMSARAIKALEAKPAHIQELVDRGLWEPCGDGFRFHNFLKYQPSREQVLKTRNETLQRVRKHRNAVTNAPVTLAPGPGPVNQIRAEDTEASVLDLKPVVQTSSPAAKRAADKLYAITLRWYDPRSEKHREPLEALGERPDSEWEKAAAVIEAEMTKPSVAGMMTPAHLLANWDKYPNGEAPVGRAEVQRRRVHEEKPQARGVWAKAVAT